MMNISILYNKLLIKIKQINNDELYKEMSFEQEEGSKKRKRNRAGSFEDKKSKDENIICKCIIF